MNQIKLAIIGVGNCASSLVQGISYYRNKTAEDQIGLSFWDIGGYKPFDVEVVAAFDIDQRKVHQPLAQALFSPPNNTTIFQRDLNLSDIKVSMGKVLDGVSEHVLNYPEHQRFVIADTPEASKESVVKLLKDSKAEVMINYLPVGSQKATEFYAECALEAGVGFVNCMPVFIASDPKWSQRFKEAKLPVIGDDMKSQIGATIIHRTLTSLFEKRGVKLTSTYQMNVGGNTDFLNMSNRQRMESKKITKTKSLQSTLKNPLSEENIYSSAGDFIPWLKDNKVCFIRLEGQVFGDIPMNVELRLSVEDSANSAAIALDAIRCCKVAMDRGLYGPIEEAAAYLMKHPPQQFPDDEAYDKLAKFTKPIC